MEESRRFDLAAFCQTDRNHLVALACGYPSGAGGSLPWARLPVPAELLESVIEDVLGFRIMTVLMPDNILGRCDFLQRRVLVNSRMGVVAMENTNLEGLEHSTLGHELGHMRLPGHEQQAWEKHRQEVSMPSLFESCPVLCRHGGDWHGALSQPRFESEADYYSSRFLVPSPQLVLREAACEIEAAWRQQRSVPREWLWNRVMHLAGQFRVTGSLMARRLREMGWIVRLEGTREIKIAPMVELSLFG